MARSLEQRLSEFLDEWEQERRMGRGLHALGERVEALEDETGQMEHRLDRHALRLRTGWEGTDRFDTGQHKVVDVEKDLLQRELARREENEQWWRRSAIKWLVAGIAWIVTLLGSIAASSWGRGK